MTIPERLEHVGRLAHDIKSAIDVGDLERAQYLSDEAKRELDELQMPKIERLNRRFDEAQQQLNEHIEQADCRTSEANSSLAEIAANAKARDPKNLAVRKFDAVFARQMFEGQLLVLLRHRVRSAEAAIDAELRGEALPVEWERIEWEMVQRLQDDADRMTRAECALIADEYGPSRRWWCRRAGDGSGGSIAATSRLAVESASAALIRTFLTGSV